MKIPLLNWEIGSNSSVSVLEGKVEKLNNELAHYQSTTPMPSLDALFGAGMMIEPETSQVINPRLLYEAARNSNELQTIFFNLKREIFRNGYEFVPKFQAKCQQCEKEFDYANEYCEVCGFATRPADAKQIERPEKFFLSVNKNGQTFEEVLEQCEDDLQCMDEIFLVLKKEYSIMGNQIVNAEVKEIVRGSPMVFTLLTDGKGRLGYSKEGQRMWVCVAHRTTPRYSHEKEGQPRCNCGLPMFPAFYRHRARLFGAEENYFLEDEIIHKSKYHPSMERGYSPIVSVWNKVEALRAMDLYVKEYYGLKRPPKGLLAFNTSNTDELEKNWEKMLAKTKGNPHLIQPIAIPSNNSKGPVVTFIDFMNTLSESQYVEIRQEFRTQIGGRFGVMPIMQGDTSTSGGLNSVLGDTPIIVRKDKRLIDILPIASLHTDYDHMKSSNGVGKYEALSRTGWTPIVYSFRQKNQKKIYSINSVDGFTQVTEDHSLFVNSEEKKGSEITLETKLDLVKPDFTPKDTDSFSSELAWALGFFLAEGYANRLGINQNSGHLQGSRVTIYQVEIEPLERCKKVFDNFFGIDSKIKKQTNTNGNPIHCLEMSHNHVFDWIDKTCYSEFLEKNTVDGKTDVIVHREKKVPIQILNGTPALMQAFVDGYWLGDGTKSERESSCAGVYKSLMAGLKFIFNSLGKTTSVSWKPNGKNHIVKIHLLKSEDYQKSREEMDVKKIECESFYGDLYDIETVDHSFVAGIGYILHHNSEGLQITVTNRAVEVGQEFWNKKVFRQVCQMFDVKDWELCLKKSEEKDEEAELDRKLKKAGIAQTMLAMGFNVELDHEGEPTMFSGTAQKPMEQSPFQQPDFGGLGSDQQFSGAPADVGKALMPVRLAGPLKAKLDKAFREVFAKLDLKRKPTETQLKGLCLKLSVQIKKEFKGILDSELEEIYKQSMRDVEKEVGVRLTFGKVDENALAAVTRSDIFKGVLENVQEGTRDRLFDAIRQYYESPTTLSDLVDKLAEATDLERSRLATIARTETHHISTIARANSYFQADPDDQFLYKWISTPDNRRTEICKELTETTETGVSRKRLKELIKQVSEAHKMHARDYSPHINCRSTLVRLAPTTKKASIQGTIDFPDVNEVNLDELNAGIEVEQEHTKDKKVAMAIALGHLKEMPDYYSRLKTMESKVKKKRVYLTEGQKAPEGTEVQTGPEGGRFYESTGERTPSSSTPSQPVPAPGTTTGPGQQGLGTIPIPSQNPETKQWAQANAEWHAKTRIDEPIFVFGTHYNENEITEKTRKFLQYMGKRVVEIPKEFIRLQGSESPAEIQNRTNLCHFLGETFKDRPVVDIHGAPSNWEPQLMDSKSLLNYRVHAPKNYIGLEIGAHEMRTIQLSNVLFGIETLRKRWNSGPDKP